MQATLKDGEGCVIGTASKLFQFKTSQEIEETLNDIEVIKDETLWYMNINQTSQSIQVVLNKSITYTYSEEVSGGRSLSVGDLDTSSKTGSVHIDGSPWGVFEAGASGEFQWTAERKQSVMQSTGFTARGERTIESSAQLEFTVPPHTIWRVYHFWITAVKEGVMWVWPDNDGDGCADGDPQQGLWNVSRQTGAGHRETEEQDPNY